MATKGALVLPAGVALHIEEGALSIQHQGDIIIEGVPAQPLHTLTSHKGDVKLSCPEALNLTKVSAPEGTVTVTGKVTMQSIEAKAVDFAGGNLKISVVNAAKSINLNGAKIEADVILAPKVDIAASLKGRASAIECGNEIGPHKLRGGFNLGEFVSLMPTGAAILRAHGIAVPAGEEEPGEEDDDPEPAAAAAEPEPGRAAGGLEPAHEEPEATPEPEPEPAPADLEAAPADLEADEAPVEPATVEAKAIAIDDEAVATPANTGSAGAEEFPLPADEFPEPEGIAATEAMPADDEINDAALAMPDADEIEEEIAAEPADEIDEAALAMPDADEIEEEIAAEPADQSMTSVQMQIQEILEYMRDAYDEGAAPEPIQHLFSYLEGNDLDGLRDNLSPLWKDLFKEIQASGSYHANAVTRSFRAIRELLGPPTA